MRRRTVISIFVALCSAFVLSVLLYSCGGSGGGSSSGKVSLFLADDISDYQQVTATITAIQLLNTGSGDSCTILTAPVTVDITNLAGVMQLVDVSSCPAVPYNRIHMEFAKTVNLMNAAGDTSLCSFASYLNSSGQPNALSCGTDTCTLDINGAVNVLTAEDHKLALDFDLKNFLVSGFGTSACTATLKVSPLNAADMERISHLEAVTGLVSNLSTTDKTFTLSRGNLSFSVLYSGITDSQQPGLNALLQRAQDDRLRTKVIAASLDLAGMTINASSITVKVEGTIENGSLNATAKTFTVVYSVGSTTKTMDVDASSAVIEGTLAEGTWVEVKLYGYNSSWFLARKVEVEVSGTVTDD
jgi:Domain of unknown function (DUF4382)